MKLNQIVNKTFPFIAFIIGIWYFCIRLLGYHFEYIPGDLGDSRFINYLLENGHYWLTGKVPSFWDAGFMYPFKNTIALSDNMLGTIPFYSIWRIFGFSPESSYQLWWVCICSLNYWCSYYVFRKWFGRSEIALILAWIFAFSIFNLGQLNYMQMIIRFMVPVVFYAVFQMLNTPSIKYFLIFCLGIVYQLYCVLYTGIYLFYFSVLFILVYYLISKKWKDLLFYFRKERVAYTFIIFLFSALTLLWLFIPYIKMSKIVGTLQYIEVEPNIPYIKSYLFPHESSKTWSFLFKIAKPEVPIWWLHYLFIGIIPFLTMVVSPLYFMYNWYKKIKTPMLLKAIIITSAIIILFHIRTKSGHSLYAILFSMPGISNIRVLTRFMNVEIFLLLIITGYFLAKIKSKYILLFILLVFTDNLFSPEHVPRKQKAALVKRKEILLTELVKCDLKKYKAVAYLDTTQECFIPNIDIMLVAQSIGINTVNGYSSYCPSGLIDFTKKNSEEGLYKWLTDQKISRDDILLIKNEIK